MNKGAISQVPTTFNYQSPLGFRFFIRRLPEVNYFVNKINIPGLTLPAAPEASPFIEIPQPGDHVVFDPLVVSFIIDEGLNNYKQLQRWLKIIGDAAGGEEYKWLANKSMIDQDGVKSEIMLSIEDSSRNQILTVNFHDAWPTSLTALQFDATQTDVQYLIATAVFRYSTYDFDDN
jgi:hypothetical protein